MRRIERYLSLGIVRPSIGVFLSLMAIVLAFYASQSLAEAAAEQWPIRVVAIFTVLRLGIFMDVVLPGALFLGIVVGLGRLQASYEIIAMAAIGAGLARILAATMVPALIVTALVAVFAILLRPISYDTIYGLEAELAVRVDLARIEPGRFQALDDEWLIFAEGRSGGTLENVLLRQRGAVVDSLLRAPRLHQERGPEGQRHLVFSGGVHAYRFERARGLEWSGRFERLTLTFTPPPPPTRERLRRARSFGYLLDSEDPVETAELQWRLHAPLGVMVLALAAVPLSRINPRHGQSARMVSGTLFVIIYYSLHSVLIEWVEQGRIPVWPGVFWLPALLAVGLAARYWFSGRRPGTPL